MKLVITQRGAEIAGGLQVRSKSQNSSDDRVRLVVTNISALTLDDQELNALCENQEAHASLFMSRDGSKLKDPVCPQWDPISLHDIEIENAQVVLLVGEDEGIERERIELGLSTLKNIKFWRRPGGSSDVAMTIESTPTLDSRIATLLDNLDSKLQIEITYAHAPKQAAMDLGSEAVRAANAQAETGKRKPRAKAGKDAAGDQGSLN